MQACGTDTTQPGDPRDLFETVREMTGSIRDLAHTVSDSGMILVRPQPDSNGERAEILSKVCWLELEGVASITDQQAENLSKVQYLYNPTSCLELINEYTVP